ncbi:MAG TPA: PilZ domain-containing protein [Sphingomicrobium sp.]
MQRMHGWVGRKDRHPIAVEAVVHRADGSTATVKLTNVSDEGCRIETGDDLTIGERLQVTIPGVGQVKAQVRWAFAGSAGAQFLAESDLCSSGSELPT